MSMKPNILLVHGAWADGSSWNKVIQILSEAGYETVAAQLKLETLEGDAETVRRAAEALAGPVLLVGHSYGGAVITEAAHLCPNAAGLVYLAAFALDKGESLAILASSSLASSLLTPVLLPSGRINMDFYGSTGKCIRTTFVRTWKKRKRVIWPAPKSRFLLPVLRRKQPMRDGKTCPAGTRFH